MFRLHDRTRRVLCQFGVLLFAAVPTAATVIFTAACHWPGREAAAARQLAQVLHVAVTVEAVEWPQPGVTRYCGLALCDGETAARFIRCDRLETRWLESSPAGKPVLALSGETVEATAAGLKRIMRLVDERLCDASAGGVDLRWRMAALNVVDEGRSTPLTQVEGALAVLDGGAGATTGFRLANVTMLEPVWLRLVRDRKTSPPRSGIELMTSGVAVPCSLLAAVWPEAASLGWATRFRGNVWAEQADHGWDLELRGQCDLEDVDLARLTPERAMSGNAKVRFRSGRIRDGRIAEADCWIVAGGGDIRRDLLVSAVSRLSLVPQGAFDLTTERIPFERLVAGIYLSPRGLSLEGAPFAGQQGVMLVDSKGNSISKPAVQPLPAIALAQALQMGDATLIPAAEQATALARWLPLPPSSAANATGGALVPPAARTATRPDMPPRK